MSHRYANILSVHLEHSLKIYSGYNAKNTGFSAGFEQKRVLC